MDTPMKSLPAELSNPIWKAFNNLRGTMNIDDFHVVLFLLCLKRDNILDIIESSNEVNLKDGFEAYFENPEYLSPVYRSLYFKVYKGILKSIDYKVLKEIFYVIKSINSSQLQNSFPDVFDSVLYNYLNLKGRMSGEFYLPIDIYRFILKFISLPEDAVIYNPFAGVATFSLFIGENQRYYGQELNEMPWALGSLRLIAHNKGDKASMLLENSVTNWNSLNLKYDLIISNPPFRHISD